VRVESITAQIREHALFARDDLVDARVRDTSRFRDGSEGRPLGVCRTDRVTPLSVDALTGGQVAAFGRASDTRKRVGHLDGEVAEHRHVRADHDRRTERGVTVRPRGTERLAAVTGDLRALLVGQGCEVRGHRRLPCRGLHALTLLSTVGVVK
jgi:hypothetical protein